MFKQEYYNQILKEYQSRFGIKNEDLNGGQWAFNRTEIKAMFLDNFLIVDIIGAFDEACMKGRWAIGTPFFRRVHDVLLLHRHQQKRTTNNGSGMHSLSSLIKT